MAPVENTNTPQNLRRLAKEILGLSLKDWDVSCATRMLDCKDGESSKSMELAAERIWENLEDGYPFAESVKMALKRKKKNSLIAWGEDEGYTKEEMIKIAKDIRETRILGPDLKLADRILSKKATAQEWKHFSLRLAAIGAQDNGEDGFLVQFLSDGDVDHGMEIAELKRHVGQVRIEDDIFVLPQPQFPAWRDIYEIKLARRNSFGRKKAPVTEVEDEHSGAGKLGSKDGSESGSRGLGLGSEDVGLEHGPNYKAHSNLCPEDIPHASDKAPISGMTHKGGDIGPLPGLAPPTNGPDPAASSHGPKTLIPPMEAGLSGSIAPVLSSDTLQNKQRVNSTGLKRDSQTRQAVKYSGDPPSTEIPPVGNVGNDPKKVRMSNPRSSNYTKKFMNTRLGGKLSYHPPETHDTYKMKVESGFSMFETWGHALLGQYVGRMPSDYLINEMKKQWNVSARFRVEEGWIVFTFDSESDLEKVLVEGPYFIHGRPLIVKRVPDKFSFHRRDVSTVPLWVRLHGLGKRYWHPDILSDIGSYIGKPLYMDTVTDERKRSSYARVLVEINLAAPVKKKITLEYDDGDSVECEFFVENQPKFCKTCCSLGHNEMECSDLARRAPVLPTQPPGRVSFADAVRAAPRAASGLPRPMVSPSIAPRDVPSRPPVGDLVATKVDVRDNVVAPLVDHGLIHGKVNGIVSSIGTSHGSDTGKMIPDPAVDASGSMEVHGHDQEQVQIESDDDDSWTECSDEENAAAEHRKKVEARAEALLTELASSVSAERLKEVMAQLQAAMLREPDGTSGKCKKKT